MSTNKSDILFPGILKGWESKDNALAYIATLGDELPGKKVLYHANTKVVSTACNLMIYRYSAKVDSIKEENNINVIELTEQSTPLKSKLSTNYSEWKE